MAAGTFPPFGSEDLGKFRQGEQFILSVALQDANQSAVDISQALITWYLYNGVGKLVATFDNQNFGGISYVTNGHDGALTLTISSDITSNLLGTYRHNLFIDFGFGHKINPLSGKFISMPSYVDNI